jgi:transcriptional regulator with XRE-family HTH domain
MRPFTAFSTSSWESMIDVAARFGENLARARERAGITQEVLSFRASLHRTEIGLLERGGRIPLIDTLVKLRDALGVTADDLLAGITWTPGDFRRGGFLEQNED